MLLQSGIGFVLQLEKKLKTAHIFLCLMWPFKEGPSYVFG